MIVFKNQSKFKCIFLKKLFVIFNIKIFWYCVENLNHAFTFEPYKEKCLAMEEQQIKFYEKLNENLRTWIIFYVWSSSQNMFCFHIKFITSARRLSFRKSKNSVFSSLSRNQIPSFTTQSRCQFTIYLIVY